MHSCVSSSNLKNINYDVLFVRYLPDQNQGQGQEYSSHRENHQSPEVAFNSPSIYSLLCTKIGSQILRSLYCKKSLNNKHIENIEKLFGYQSFCLNYFVIQVCFVYAFNQITETKVEMCRSIQQYKPSNHKICYYSIL